MSSEDKIVPITRGDRTPKPGFVSVIVGSTRVDIDTSQRASRRPATVIELVRQQGQTGAKPEERVWNRPATTRRESNQ